MSPARQIAGFIARFDPPMARRIRACRAALRRRLPTAIELVYDNYNFLVFGFCTEPRASTGIVSIAAYSHGVNLFFLRGKGLPDPGKRLRGSGNQVRSLTLEGPQTLAEPEIEALLRAAIARHPTRLPATRGRTVVQSVSAKQRPRRAAR